jgi:hypothetical protein
LVPRRTGIGGIGSDQALMVRHAKPRKDARITVSLINPSFSVFVNVLATIDI